jgi:hypothetical protein
MPIHRQPSGISKPDGQTPKGCCVTGRFRGLAPHQQAGAHDGEEEGSYGECEPDATNRRPVARRRGLAARATWQES